MTKIPERIYMGFIDIENSRVVALKAATADFLQPDQVVEDERVIRFYDLDIDQMRTVGYIANHLAGQNGDMFWTGKLLDCKFIRELQQ